MKEMLKYQGSKVLLARNLNVQFDVKGQPVDILSDVNFELERGETLGVVGESGCGKSMTALALLNMVPSPPCLLYTSPSPRD